jgi:hypothetical protein
MFRPAVTAAAAAAAAAGKDFNSRVAECFGMAEPPHIVASAAGPRVQLIGCLLMINYGSVTVAVAACENCYAWQLRDRIREHCQIHACSCSSKGRDFSQDFAEYHLQVSLLTVVALNELLDKLLRNNSTALILTLRPSGTCATEKRPPEKLH